MATLNLFMTLTVNSIGTSLMVLKRSLPIMPEQPQATRMAAVGCESAGARVGVTAAVSESRKNAKRLFHIRLEYSFTPDSDTGSFTPDSHTGSFITRLLHIRLG